MYLFKKVQALQNYLRRLRQQGQVIGFAPTMGALHPGHISLINSSKSITDATVCSIFVNPTQFNDKTDLDKYPRSFGRDVGLLTNAACDILFMPPVEEVYPPDLDTTVTFHFGQLDTVMEGKFRPGHFDGMAQVVKRLLDIVEPDKLFMGQKDFQQLTIVREMLRQLASPIELIMCPIVREADGLALSSRNARLDSKLRPQAAVLQQTLQQAKMEFNHKSIKQIQVEALKTLSLPGFRPEYFEVVDGISLQAITDSKQNDWVVACTAVWVGEVRLIDNIILKSPAS